MGLQFYPRLVAAAPDHPIHEKLQKIPERFITQKPRKDWVIEGPFFDEEDELYYFVVKCPAEKIMQQIDISESDFFLSPPSVEGWISRTIACVMEAELGTAVAQRLMGKSNEEVAGNVGNDEVVMVEDYSRGTGSVHRGRLSRDGDGDTPENKGGLILPP